MKTYRKEVRIVPNHDIPEKTVFCKLIIEIRIFDTADGVELDLYKAASNAGMISRFSSIKINVDKYPEIEDDVMNFEVEEFWDKYTDLLKGHWQQGQRIII